MKIIRAMVPALAIVAGASGILSGCAYNTDDPMAMQGNPYKPYIVGAPYQVNGKWYYPKEDFSYDRVGIASWYGPGFDGHRTANGETYDMDLLTAAHPTLPMPTLVEVTNLENGRSVVVRINDRGPYHGNRIIDLSRRAAEDIGLKRDGIGRVRVRVLRTASLRLKHKALADLGRTEERERRKEVAEQVRADVLRRPASAADTKDADITATAEARRAASAPRGRPGQRKPTLQANAAPFDPSRLNAISPGAGPTTVGRPIRLHPDAPAKTGLAKASLADPGDTGKKVFIQVGSFTERSNALRTGDRLRGIALTRIAVRKVDRTVFYRVRVGPVATRREGKALLGRIRRKGYEDARIVVE